MPRRLIRAMTAAILLTSPAAADAQLITFEFTATVSSVPPLLSGGPIAIGQTVSGSFTFNSTVADSDPSSVRGLYESLVAFEISIPAAGYSATASPGSLPGFVEIFDDEGDEIEPNATRRDRYVASMSAPDQIMSGPALNGAPLERLAILLRARGTIEAPPQAFSSDALPLTPPSLQDFPIETSLILGFDVGSAGPGELSADLNSFTASEVSVPVLIEELAGSVDGLEIGGSINGGQANSLRQKLDQALAHVGKSEPGPAVNLLKAFQNQINAYIRSRRMTAAAGAALISAAENIIEELDGP